MMKRNRIFDLVSSLIFFFFLTFSVQSAQANPPLNTNDSLVDSDNDEDEKDWALLKSAKKKSSNEHTQFLASYRLQAAVDLKRNSFAEVGYREDSFDLNGKLKLSLKHWLNKSVALKAGTQFYWRITARAKDDRSGFLSDLHRTDLEAYVDDSYLDWKTRWIDLRVGYQTVIWGASDLYNPNDVLNPKDFRFGPIAFLNGEHISLPMVKADFYWKGFNLTALWQPFFQAHRYELFGSDYALLNTMSAEEFKALSALVDDIVDDSIEGTIQSSLNATSKPRPFVDSSFAFRLARSVKGWDLALQYYYGYQRFTSTSLSQDVALLLASYFYGSNHSRDDLNEALAPLLLDGNALKSSFPRSHQLGFSLSKALWRMILQVDISYITKSPQPVALSASSYMKLLQNKRLHHNILSDVFSYTLGLRLQEGEFFLLSIQWWHEMLIDKDSDIDLLLGDAHRGGVSLLMQFHTKNQKLSGQLFMHSDILNHSLMTNPQVSYRFMPALSFDCGAALYVGQSSFGALLAHNNQIYIGAHGNF